MSSEQQSCESDDAFITPFTEMRQCRGAEGSPVWALRIMSGSLVSLPGRRLWGPYVAEMLVIRQLNDNF